MTPSSRQNQLQTENVSFVTKKNDSTSVIDSSDNPMGDFEILKDSILIDTQNLIKRDLKQFKVRSQFQNKTQQEKNMQLMTQISDTCQNIDLIAGQSNKLSQTTKQNEYINTLTLNNPTPLDRQQAALHNFYNCTQLYPNVQMPQKIQRMMFFILYIKKRIESSQKPQEIVMGKKQFKILGLFSELGDDAQHEQLLEQALLREFFLLDQKAQSDKLIEEVVSKGMLLMDNIGRKKVEFYNKVVLQKWFQQHNKQHVRMEQMRIDQMNLPYKKRIYSFQSDQNSENASKKQNRSRKINRSVNSHQIEIIEQFINSDIEIKRKANLRAIDFLLDFNSSNLPQDIQDKLYRKIEQRKESGTVDQISTNKTQKFLASCHQEQVQYVTFYTRKFFFKFSNKQESDLNRIYREICKESLIEFFQYVGLEPKHLDLAWIEKKFNKQTKDKVHKVFRYEEFIEIIRNASHVCQTMQTSPHDSPKDSNKALAVFYASFLMKHQENIYEPLHAEIINCKCFVEFQEKFQNIFVSMFQFSFKVRGIGSSKQRFLKFDDIFEVMWRINIFPRLLSKSVLRLYYYYIQISDEGLEFEQFCIFINLIGLSIIRSQPNREQMIIAAQKDRTNQLLFSNLGQSLAKRRMTKVSYNLLTELGIFYTYPQFLDGSNLQLRLNQFLLDSQLKDL